MLALPRRSAGGGQGGLRGSQWAVVVIGESGCGKTVWPGAAAAVAAQCARLFGQGGTADRRDDPPEDASGHEIAGSALRWAPGGRTPSTRCRVGEPWRNWPSSTRLPVTRPERARRCSAVGVPDDFINRYSFELSADAATAALWLVTSPEVIILDEPTRAGCAHPGQHHEPEALSGTWG